MSNTSTWERTSVQNLLRNRKSGRYYGRWTISGKQKWVALDTDVFTVAKLRLGDEAAKISRTRGAGAAVASGTATMGELMAELLVRIGQNSELRPATKVSWQTAVRKIEKTWPALSAMKPANVTPAAVEAWANRFKADGTNFRPNGAKTTCKGNSARSVNRAIDALARAFEIAIEQGALHRNPAKVAPKSGRLKKRITQKRLSLPSRAQLAELFTAMENNGARGGWGREAADFCRFLAYSGARMGEAAVMTWDKVDWQRSLVSLPGYKTESSDRIIPLFQDLATLLRAVMERRKLAARFSVNGKPDLAPTDSIFRLKECQKTIDAACAKTGCPRITHHDLRHVFATVCIESGVDIPTVSRWLGHADGGALAMRTYGHLRQEHILFIDSTHVAKIGSDVTFLLLQVLPRLKRGVLVHVHDIFYPQTYPIEWLQEGRAWNESLFLRAFLTNNSAFEIIAFNGFAVQTWPELFQGKLSTYLENSGSSIWIRKCAEPNATPNPGKFQ